MRIIHLRPRGDEWSMSGPGFTDHAHDTKQIAVDHAKKTAREQGHDQINIYDEAGDVIDRITQHELGVVG